MPNPFGKNANLIGAITAIACCNIAFGLLFQIIPLLMDARGFSAGMIGLNSAMGQLGVFLSGLSLPWLLSRFQGRLLSRLAIVLLIVSLALFAATGPYWLWHVLRFMSGVAIALLFTVSETWIQSEAGARRRGRVMGLYVSVLTVTFGIGPFLISWFGAEGAVPWLAGIACLAIGFLVISLTDVTGNTVGHKSSGFAPVIGKAPMVFLCIGITSLFEAVMLSFITIFSMRHGLTQSAASQLIGTGIVGCLLFFYPLGRLADKWSRDGTVLICAATAILASLAMLPAIATWWAWPLIVILRAGAFGVYTVALTLIGDTFKDSELVAGQSLVAILWGLSGIAGPPVAGAIIDRFGIDTLPYMLAACYVAVVAAILVNGGTVIRKAAPAGSGL